MTVRPDTSATAGGGKPNISSVTMVVERWSIIRSASGRRYPLGDAIAGAVSRSHESSTAPVRTPCLLVHVGRALGGGGDVEVAVGQGEDLVAPTDGLAQPLRARRHPERWRRSAAHPPASPRARRSVTRRRTRSGRTKADGEVEPLGAGAVWSRGLGGLPATRSRTASGTAGSTSQVTGREPAAAPKSTSERRDPPLSSVRAQAETSTIRPLGPYRTSWRIGITSAVLTEPLPPWHQRQEGAGPAVRDVVARLARLPERVDAEPVDPGIGSRRGRTARP